MCCVFECTQHIFWEESYNYQNWSCHNLVQGKYCTVSDNFFAKQLQHIPTPGYNTNENFLKSNHRITETINESVKSTAKKKRKEIQCDDTLKNRNYLFQNWFWGSWIVWVILFICRLLVFVNAKVQSLPTLEVSDVSATNRHLVRRWIMRRTFRIFRWKVLPNRHRQDSYVFCCFFSVVVLFYTDFFIYCWWFLLLFFFLRKNNRAK